MKQAWREKNVSFWYSILPVFNPQTAFFYCFGPKLCLKEDINMPSVFLDLKNIEIGENRMKIS